MLKKSLYIFIFFSALSFKSVAQSILPDDPAIFGDSVGAIYNEFNGEQLKATGDDFASIWTRLGLDQQQKVISQMKTLEEKGWKLNPQMQTYIMALVNAVDGEAAEPQKITEYLNASDKVLKYYQKEQMRRFFRFSETFFLHKSLFYDKSNKLYLNKGDYTFDFIEPEIAEEEVEEPVEDYEDEYAEDEYDDNYEEDEWWEEEEETNDDWNTEWEEEYDDEYYDDYDDNYVDESYEEESYDDEPLIILPPIEGVILKLENTALNFVTGYDSVFVEDVQGTYLIDSKQFVGDGGRFDWSMAGLPADSVYVKLSKYSFDVEHARLKAEAAKLTYTGMLTEPVEGVFEYKGVKHDTTTDARYPKFMSYQSNIRLKNLGEGLIYKGGFSLDGNKIKSASLLGQYSMIEVQSEGTGNFRAKAKLFEFKDSLLITERAMLVIYQGSDSVYHPAVRLTYDMDNRFLTVQKDKGGFRNTPYTSSFFNLDFTSDIIRWDVDSDSLDISILQARNIVPAYFESADHYNSNDYRSLGDKLYDFNPLAVVVYYANKNRLEEFYVEDLAKQYNKDKRVMRGAMLGLAEKGLIGFDSQTNLITIKGKSKHLYNSKQGAKDYDNIVLASVTSEKPNATLNFPKRSMTVRGVESFKISDSLNVVIQPDSSEITFLKNRDFTFDGRVLAGNFEYIGRDFTFQYDSFLIYLNEIDSIRFYIQEENSRGGGGRRRVENSLTGVDTVSNQGSLSNNLQGSSGVLYINKPNNKSAKIPLPNYPKFNSEKGGIVYFDRKQVLGGVYDRSMYFLVPPFDLDSLGGANSSAIAFNGTFVSSGMFPVFTEKLTIQSDFSLGFEHDVPSEGYKLYEGEGTFYEKLRLDNNGIRGNGRIEFLTSRVESEDFVFYPDSVVGSGNYFEMREEEYNGVTFPQIEANSYDMHWLPKKDSMYINTSDEAFHLYDQSATLEGQIVVSNGGVNGEGTLETRGSTSESESIKIEHDGFNSRHTQFILQSDNPDKPALHGDDVRVRFDLTENYAIISPEVEGEAAIEFPYAQFNTSITEARWDLDEELITMTKPRDVPLENSYFYSTREDLDSLAFMATEAEYDINTLELTVRGIPYIIVADAKITPENNEVLILENSKIGQLTNTTIILDTLNGYHRLTEGVIDIKSRNEFSGYATYQFVNIKGDTTPIKMENFRLEEISNPNAKRGEPESSLHTVANGSVTEGQNLLVSPGMYYKGDMILYAHQPAMELNGFVKLDIDEPAYNIWIAYESNADQEEVIIDYDNATTEDGRKLEAGLHFSSGDNSLYNTFITEKFSPDDEDFFSPSGHLFFDELKNEFVIEDTAKANGNKLSGQIYRFNHASSKIQFEGKANFIPSTKDFDVLSSVIGTGNIDDLTFDINALLSIDIPPVPTQAMDLMATDFLDVINNIGVPEGYGDPTELLYKLADLAGERAAQEYEARSKQEYTSLAGFVKETTTSLVLSNVDFKWSPDYKGFYSDGKIGMSNIRSTDINGAFDGFMEVKRSEDGVTILNLFIKASPDSWYYFSYEDNRLLIFSSNNAFNEVISKKSNGAKAKIGDLVFAPADKAETLNFINRFRLQYYGIDELYELDSEVEEELPVSEDGFGGTEEDEEDDGFEDDDDGF